MCAEKYLNKNSLEIKALNGIYIKQIHSKELSIDTFGCASKSVIVLINPSKFTM